MTDSEKVEVVIPSGKVELPWELWRMLGAVNLALRRALGDDNAFSLIVSRTARDVRQRVGIDQAREVFAQYAAQMPIASKYDDPSAGPHDPLSDADAVELLKAIRFIAMSARASLAADVTDSRALTLGYIAGIAETGIAGMFDLRDLK